MKKPREKDQGACRSIFSKENIMPTKISFLKLPCQKLPRNHEQNHRKLSSAPVEACQTDVRTRFSLPLGKAVVPRPGRVLEDTHTTSGT